MRKRWGERVRARLASLRRRLHAAVAEARARWRQHAAVALAIFAVQVLAVLGDRSDPAENIWTSLGAGGSVYAWQVFRRRWLVDQWRRQHHINSLFQIACQQHLVLRGLGFAMQILILLAGLGAMVNAPRFLILAALIGVAALATVAAWYAERKAEQQAAYILKHPEA